MRKTFKILLVVGLLMSCSSKIDNAPKNYRQDVIDLAKVNGIKPLTRIVAAILEASDRYKINPLELTAIGIVETGLGSNVKTRKNSNGTIDRGVFQINSVNNLVCIEYNLDSVEGSAFCAAKLLSIMKLKHKDFLGRFHSKTPSKKMKYLKKIAKVFKKLTDK